MTRAAIGLGGNLGDAATTLRQAFDALGALPGTRLLHVSRLYRTPAWGLTAQPDFINAVAVVETTLAPMALLEHLLAIERRFGRVRVDGERWGPRTLDLDLLLHGEAVVGGAELTLPHPRMHERAFVLLPLLEIAPHVDLPGLGAAHAFLPAVAGQAIERSEPM